MLPRLAKVFQDIAIAAARFLQSVGHDGRGVEVSLIITALSKVDHGGSEPRRIEPDGAERKTSEDAPQTSTLNRPLRCHARFRWWVKTDYRGNLAEGPP